MRARFFSDYGMLLVLAALCAFLSVWTLTEQQPGGASAAEQLADEILTRTSDGAKVVIIARDGQEDQAFVQALDDRLIAANRTVAARVIGQPSHANQALQQLAQ